MGHIINDLTIENSVTLEGTAVGTPVNQIPDQTNNAGSATSLTRSDHVHNIPTASASGLNANSTNTQGSASSFTRSDHTHALSSGAPSTQTPDQTNTTGTSANLARADHIHNIPTATASGITTSSTNTQGSASSFARSDHTHAVSVTNIEISSTTNAILTSPSDVLMTDMTISLTPGTYLLVFSTSITSTANNGIVYISFYLAGSQIVSSERRFRPTVANAPIIMMTNYILTVPTTGTLEVQWRRSTGTVTAYNRALDIVRLSN